MSRLLVLCLAAGAPHAGFSATLPAGFTETVVATMSDSPTAMEVSPDGKLFIAQQNGVMPVWKNGAQLSANFFSNTPLNTGGGGERGLLGIAFDPNYAANRYVYVYYTVNGGDFRNRVSRFTSDASGNLALAGSETVIWEGDAHASLWHNGGAIHFGPDGKLYIATGDNDAGSATAQSLASQHGKILRINANGSIPLDNPFHDGSGPNRDAIWSLGLRNPFTFAFQPGTGRMFVNDVGAVSWEEINDGGPNPSGRGLNYGWAATEGDFNQGSFPNFRRPFFAYNRYSGQPRGLVITGGAFYSPSTNTFGSDYQGDYFFADWRAGWIFRIDTSTKAVTEFAADAFAVDLKVTDDGSLYYLSYRSQQVLKVTKAAPPAVTSQPQDRRVGAGSQASFTVETFEQAEIQWQRSNDNGASWHPINGATSKTLAFTALLADNNALFRAVVSNGFGSNTSNPAKLTVVVNTAPSPPVITLTGGLTDSKYVTSRSFTFSGTAYDPEDGVLAPGAFEWRVDLLYDINKGDGDNDGKPGRTYHIPAIFRGVTNASYRAEFSSLPDQAVLITSVVTDSLGGTNTSNLMVHPKISTITLGSDPPGLQLTVGGAPATTPSSFPRVAGSWSSIQAPLTQVLNGTNCRFLSWSDDARAQRWLYFPENDVTYFATYSRSTVPAPWWNEDVGSVGDSGTASQSADVFTVNGSGFLRGNADAFHYVYQEAAGDCSITARVADLPYDSIMGNNARAGVMIRTALTPDSPHLFMGVRANGRPQTVFRSKSGGKTEFSNAGSGLAPYWVRVTRVGNTLTAFRSVDGLKWTKVRSKKLKTMESTVYIGLAVSSEGSGARSATFDNVDAVP